MLCAARLLASTAAQFAHRTEHSPIPDPAQPGFSPAAAAVARNRLAARNRIAAAGSCLRAAAGSRPRRSLESHPPTPRGPNLRRQEVALSLCYNLKKWRATKPKLIYCLYKTRANWIAGGRVL